MSEVRPFVYLALIAVGLWHLWMPARPDRRYDRMTLGVACLILAELLARR